MEIYNFDPWGKVYIQPSFILSAFCLKKQRETGYSLVKNIQLLYKGIREFKAMDHGK